MKQVGSRPNRTSSSRLSAKFNLEKTPLHAEGLEDDEGVSQRTIMGLGAIALVSALAIIATLVVLGWSFFSQIGTVWQRQWQG